MVYSPPANSLALALDRQRRTRPAYAAAMASLPSATRDAIGAYVGALSAEASARRQQANRAPQTPHARGANHKKNGTS